MKLHNQTQKDKNSSNAFSPETASCIWARFTPKKNIKGFSNEEVDKLFNNYEAKLSGQMVKSLGKSIINMYSMGVCAALGISNQDALSEDQESDPFLNSALQRFTCELYYRFGSFLAPLSVGLITSRHYLCECNKMEEQVEWEMSKNSWGHTVTPGPQGPSASSKSSSSYEVIGSFIGMGMVGFWFGIGAMLAVKTVNSLECCIEELISSK